jgi:hypothetical protein
MEIKKVKYSIKVENPTNVIKISKLFDYVSNRTLDNYGSDKGVVITNVGNESYLEILNKSQFPLTISTIEFDFFDKDGDFENPNGNKMQVCIHKIDANDQKAVMKFPTTDNRDFSGVVINKKNGIDIEMLPKSKLIIHIIGEQQIPVVAATQSFILTPEKK